MNKMEYISNNPELKQAIIDSYNRKILPYQLADIYFKYKLYSAASTYYNWQIYDLHNCSYDKFDVKSYCFSQLAQCYYNQQQDHEFSGWQLSMIHDMCKEAISYNRQNYQAILLLGICQIKQNQQKEAYFTYNQFILNLNQYQIFEEDLMNIYKMFFTYFDLCEKFFIIKYDYVYKIMLNFISSYDLFDYTLINDFNNRYKEHINKVSKYEQNIILGQV